VIGRRLAVAAVAALAAIPFTGALAAPGTTDLPNALANPLESSFVEDTSSRDIPLGFFDAGVWSNWAGTDASDRDYIRNGLVSNGFVTGYQRFWYMRNGSDAMYETVFVFEHSDGADNMLSTQRSDLSQSSWFKSWVPVQLNASAFALQEVGTEGFHWTFAGFAKANDVFELFRGSKSDYQTNAALAQASEMYTVAPNGTVLSSQPARSRQSALAQFRTPLVITFVAGALFIAAALLIAVVVTLLPRSEGASLRT